MTARLFVDTSVVAYSFDSRDPEKRSIANSIVEKRSEDLVVSTQVLLELHSVCVRKFRMDPGQAQAALRVSSRFAVTPADRDLVGEASGLAARTGLSIYDAAIVCAAKRSNCEVLLAEDSDFGASVEGLKVVNPFVANDGF